MVTSLKKEERIQTFVVRLVYSYTEIRYESKLWNLPLKTVPQKNVSGISHL